MDNRDDPKPTGRFVKGQSGNPGGRPAGVSFAAILGAKLEEIKGGKSTREKLVDVAITKALKGDMQALQWIVDRTDGKLKDTTDLTGELVVRVLRDRVG